MNTHLRFSVNSQLCGPNVGHPLPVLTEHPGSESERFAALGYMIALKRGHVTGPCQCGNELVTYGQMTGPWAP